MTGFALWNSVLEHIVSLPGLVLVAYGLCLGALALFSALLRRDGARLRRRLRRALSERERG